MFTGCMVLAGDEVKWPYKHSQCDKSAADVFIFLQPETDVVGQDGDHVYHRHYGAHELYSVRRSVQPQQIL